MISIILTVCLAFINVLSLYSMIRYFIFPLICYIKESADKYIIKKKISINSTEHKAVRLYQYAYKIRYSSVSAS